MDNVKCTEFQSTSIIYLLIIKRKKVIVYWKSPGDATLIIKVNIISNETN